MWRDYLIPNFVGPIADRTYKSASLVIASDRKERGNLAARPEIDYMKVLHTSVYSML